MWPHHHLCCLFRLVGIDGDLQNGARECPPTDHIQHNLTSYFGLTWLRNPCPQDIFFIARCTDDTESIGIETTGIASVACLWLISAIRVFRAILTRDLLDALNAPTFPPSYNSGLARRSHDKLSVAVRNWMNHPMTNFQKHGAKKFWVINVLVTSLHANSDRKMAIVCESFKGRLSNGNA